MHAPKRICSSVFRVEGAAATGGATTNLVNAYCKPLQMYQQPLEIAYFSYDHQRQLLLNSRSELVKHHQSFISIVYTKLFHRNTTIHHP